MSRQSWDALEDRGVLFGHFSMSDAGPARHPKGSSREVVPRRRSVDDDLNLSSGLERKICGVPDFRVFDYRLTGFALGSLIRNRVLYGYGTPA